MRRRSLMAAVSRGSRLKEPGVAQASLETVKACQEKIVAKTEEINTKQKELEKLLQKKPKNSDFRGSRNFLCIIQIKGQWWWKMVVGRYWW